MMDFPSSVIVLYIYPDLHNTMNPNVSTIAVVSEFP